MKALLTLVTSLAVAIIAFCGLSAKSPGGSDRQPPVNNATVYFENAWLTLKFGAINLAHDLGSIAMQAFENTWASFARIGFVAPLRLCAATAARDTQVRDAVIASYPVAASTTLYLGTMIALDSSGNAVNAADTAGLRVVGRAEQSVDNSAGIAGALTVNVRRGCFKWANSGTQAVTAAYKDKLVYAEDNQTVAISTTNKVVAGRVIEVASDGGIWVDSTDRGAAGAAAVTTVGAAVAGTAATNSTPYGFAQAQADAIVANVNALRVDVLALAAKINGG